MTIHRNVQSNERPARANPGFTLIELLVVMVVLSVVTTLGTTTFFKMTNAWFSLKRLTELDGIAEDAFESMRRDFSDVLSTDLTGHAIRGVSNDAETREGVDRVIDDNDLILIPVQGGVEASSSGDSPGAKVMYKIARGEERHSAHELVRIVGRLDQDLDKNILVGGPLNTAPIISSDQANIIRLRFEYAGNDGQWQSEWYWDDAEPESPRLVRVSMTLVDPNQTHLQVSRKSVFPIRAR